MLCEKCQQREASTHLTVTVFSGEPSGGETCEHHFCASCAASSPLANPKMKYGPDVISEWFRVVGVSADYTKVRLIRNESNAVPEEWSFLTSRLPSQYAVVGMEFGITCSPLELEQLKGTKRTDGNAV